MGFGGRGGGPRRRRGLLAGSPDGSGVGSAMGAAVTVGGSDSATGTILGADDSSAATVSLDLLVATLAPYALLL